MKEELITSPRKFTNKSMHRRLTRQAAVILAAASVLCAIPPSRAMAQTITTIAGGYLGDGVRATSAAFVFTPGIAQDKYGNYYASDLLGNRIRKIDGRTGLVSTFAGTGVAGYNGDKISASKAQLSSPAHLRFDPQGDLVVSDSGNCLVRKIDSAGIITNIAGNQNCGFSGDVGSATAVSIGHSYGIEYDPAGNLYVSDYQNNMVHMVDPAGRIHPFAGFANVSGGFAGDHGPALQAQLNFPIGVQADTSGNIYIADSSNHRVRKVDAGGTITTFAGNGTPGYSGDGGNSVSAEIHKPRGLAFNNGALYISDGGDGRIRSVDIATDIIQTFAGSTTGYDGDGHALVASQFNLPGMMIFNLTGNLVVADAGNGRVREAGTVMSTIAGGYLGDGLNATSAAFLSPTALATDLWGNSYIVDQSTNRVRKVNAFTGEITTVAGNGSSGYAGDRGQATTAELWFPNGVAVDLFGNIFISDSNNRVIRKVDPSGKISTFASNPQFNSLGHIALDFLGNLYVVDQSACVVWKINHSGAVAAFAGVPGVCGYGDGPSRTAQLNQPSGLALDLSGDVYIADSGNNLIRRVDTTGNVTTIAGTPGTAGFSGDGGPATSATLNDPQDVLARAGTIYIADTNNSRIRVVGAGGVITTYAGTGAFGYNGNGMHATQTELETPVALSQNLFGTLFELDAGQLLLRRIQ